MILRHMLRLDISALQNNIVVCLLVTLYVKIGMETIHWWRSRFWFLHYSRELFHVLMSSTVHFWSLFDTSDWSWRLVGLVPAVLMARFVYKGGMVKNPEDIEVQSLSRSSSPSELLVGPFFCAAVLVWCSWNLFGRPESAVIAASLAVTDGFSPMIGKFYGVHVYHHHPSTKRTEGMIMGAFLGTVLFTYVYQWWMAFPLSPLRIVLVYGGITAIVGTLFKGMDNLAVPVTLHLLTPRIQMWLAV